MRGQRLAELDALVAAARAEAEASNAAAAEGQAVARGLAERVAALEVELGEARSEAAVKAGSMENMSARASELMRDLAAARAASEAKDGIIAGGCGAGWALSRQMTHWAALHSCCLQPMQGHWAVPHTG